MKKAMKYLCVVMFCSLLLGWSGEASAAAPAEEAPPAFNPEEFITVEEAIGLGEELVEIFNIIIGNGSYEQYAGTGLYSALLEWRDVRGEIGIYEGIGKTSAVVDTYKASIRIEVLGTKRNAMFEIEFYPFIEPEFTIYSTFSWRGALNTLAPYLTALNTLILLVLIIFVLRRNSVIAKELQLCGKGENVEKAIDMTITQIIETEENGEKQAEEEMGAKAEMDAEEEISAEEGNESGEKENEE